MLTIGKGSLGGGVLEMLQAGARDAWICVEPGSQKVKQLAASWAGTGRTIGIYMKAPGAYDPNDDTRDSAVWSAAQPLLWGSFEESDQGWKLADIQNPDKARRWADVVVIPRIQTFLDQAPNCYSLIMLDDTLMFPGNISPDEPDDFDPLLFQAGTLIVMQRVQAKFPWAQILPNGYAGWNSEGARGLAHAEAMRALYFEQFARKVNGDEFSEPSRLEQQINDAWLLGAKGCLVVGHDYYDATDYDLRLNTLVVYLLTQGARTYLHLDPTALGAKPAELELGTMLGKPKFGPKRIGAFMFRRYTEGLVAMNVSGSSADLNVVWPYATLGGGGGAWSSAGGVQTLDHGAGVIMREP